MIKKNNIHVYILEQNPTSGYVRIKFLLLAVIISRVLLYLSQYISDVIINYVNINAGFVASN